MKIRTIILTALAACTLTTAEPQERDPLKTHDIGQVVVYGRRLNDIGVTKTRIDSADLRDRITSSLADVLSQSTSIFIKSYGRATLASASFRGTAPSHTQVTWNGVRMNSPMLGMVDFSLIPSFFIDEATLYHGAGSVGISGGGLGGAIALGSKAPVNKGLGLNYIQGIGSYDTFDQFLKVSWGGKKWQTSTRVSYAVSDNDFRFRNYEKDGYPVERNRSGQFRDLHVLRELFYSPNDRNRFGLSVWYVRSDRGVPVINVKYGADGSRSDQMERTLRAVADWERRGVKTTLGAKAGYVYSNMRFGSWEDNGEGALDETLNAQSFVSTGFASFSADYRPVKDLLLTAEFSAHLHAVSSQQRKVNILIGYEKTRLELSALAAAKYRVTKRLGVGADLRMESYGNDLIPPIPAGFVDYILWERFNVVAKSSVARNYRYPTLNDLYFLPGGNDTLKVEKGFTWDAGIEFAIHRGRFSMVAEATIYDSQIRDWIVWLPDHRGFWSPENVRRVHSYGVELKGRMSAGFGRGWSLALAAQWSRTRSVNHGDPAGWSDASIGKQLVYVPEYSNSATGRLAWKEWSFTYMYNYYSERYATTSNEKRIKLYTVHAYYMNDISLERRLRFARCDLTLKTTVNNLFDEEYVSVLGHPMPGRNYGVFIGITPKWRRAPR